MPRIFLSLVLVGTLMASTPARAHDNHRVGKPGRGPCAIAWNYRPHSSHLGRIKARVRDIIDCAVDRWPVSGGSSQARAVARCESSFYPWAHSPSWRYLGIFQESSYVYSSGKAPHWKDWFPAPGDPGRYNARANILAGVRYAHQHGWDAWACA